MAKNYQNRLRSFLTRQGSPLARYADLIARTEAKYKLPTGIIAGIAGAETSFGKAGAGPGMHNYWGWMTGAGPPNQRSFANPQQAIRQYGRFLSSNYINAGYRTPEQIVRRYVGSDSPTWLNNVNSTLRALGAGGTAPPTVAPGGATSGPGRGPGRGPRRGPNANVPAPANNVDRRMLLLSMMSMIGDSDSSATDLFPFMMALRDSPQTPVTQPGVNPPRRQTQGNATNGRSGARMAPGRILGRTFTAGGGPDAHGSRPLGNWQSDHAWDLMAPAGTPVYALVDGVVDPNAGFGFSSNGSSVWGHRLTIRGGGNGFFYTHLGGFAPGIRRGAKVKKGQLIGWIGDPPSMAQHLHIGLEHGDLYDYIRR